MKWQFLEPLPPGENSPGRQIELAKLEALRAIVEELALLRTDIQHLELELAKPGRGSMQLDAARTELLNVLNIFEGHLTAWTGGQSREQYLALLERARELLR